VKLQRVSAGRSQRFVAGKFEVAKSTAGEELPEKSRIVFLPVTYPCWLKSVALFVNQNLSLLIQLDGGGFVSNAQRGHQ